MSISLDVRLALRPGLRAVPREPGVLQVGLDPPYRTLLPDHPDVRRLLDALASGSTYTVASAEAATALGRLERAGLLVPGVLGERVDAAAVARHGSSAAQRSAARARCRPRLEVPAAHRPEVLRLMRLAGLGEPASSKASEASGATGVALLVVEGEYSRSRVDGWVRDGVAHLCVQAHDGVVSLGPYVVPGVTACRRCVDAHLGETDPRRPMIVEQLARRPTTEPVDDLLLALALNWAVQDLATAAEGERPGTWSTTIRLEPALATQRRSWTRHPHCGCSWDQWPA